METECILQAIRAQAAAQPDAPAVLHVDGAARLSYSYGRLIRDAYATARHLRSSAGLAKDGVVGLLSDEAPGVVIGFLAIAMACGVVVPLDPGAPEARLAALLEDSAASLVLCDASWVAPIRSKLRSAGEPLSMLHMVALETALAGGGESGSAVGGGSCSAVGDEWSPPSGSSLCHLIYTSGSTGRPKAVAVRHAALHAYCAAKLRAHAIDGRARVLLASAHTWDPCLGDVFSTLAAGALLCTAPRAALVHELGHTLEATACTHVCLTPSLWSLVTLEPSQVPIELTRPDSTRLDSTRPDSTRLDSTRPDSTRLDSTRLDSTRPDST